MAVVDQIKCDGNSNDSQRFTCKCPSEQFILGSQLIVNQGQEALSFKGGEALDLFDPGTHTLSTDNLPILNKLISLSFGGKTPFSAKICCINKTANLDVKWGTSTPIPLEDPRYGLILNVDARGQYGITITDSRLFVSKIIGAVPNGTTTNPMFVLRYFNSLINSKIKSVTAAYMIQKQISFLEISQSLSGLSVTFQGALNKELERFGIKLVNFYCKSIAPKPEEYKKLRGYREEPTLGEGFCQQRRSLDILEKLAEDPSFGSIANAGIGLGMGFGVADQFGNVFSGIGQDANVIKPDTRITHPKCGAQNNSTMKFYGSCGSKPATTVICPHYGEGAPDGVKFCSECGKPLNASECPSCGFENKPGIRFCGSCGEKL